MPIPFTKIKTLPANRGVVIVKHSNPCGVSILKNNVESYKFALACDPISAFGGIVSCNFRISKTLALELNKIFLEVIVANGFEKNALKILKSKKNRIIIKLNKIPSKSIQSRSCLNGFLEQDVDNKIEDFQDFKVVTNKSPNNKNSDDLVIASIIAKHTKSNCIVIVKDQQLIGSGMGQVSRIDALDQAIEKSKKFGFEYIAASPQSLFLNAGPRLSSGSVHESSQSRTVCSYANQLPLPLNAGGTLAFIVSPGRKSVPNTLLIVPNTFSFSS